MDVTKKKVLQTDFIKSFTRIDDDIREYRRTVRKKDMTPARFVANCRRKFSIRIEDNDAFIRSYYDKR